MTAAAAVTVQEGTDRIITYAEAVGEAGFFGRIWIGLQQMLGMA